MSRKEHLLNSGQRNLRLGTSQGQVAVNKGLWLCETLLQHSKWESILRITFHEVPTHVSPFAVFNKLCNINTTYIAGQAMYKVGMMFKLPISDIRPV